MASSIYRSSVFSKVGLLDEAMQYDAEVDWFFRAWEQKIEKKVISKTSLVYCQPNMSIDEISSSQVYSARANYTIISNDCWGGSVYQSFGHIYETPFVGTLIIKHCYLKLLKNLSYYLNCPLEFSPHSKYPDINKNREAQYYPIGVLGGDIEIYFYHELEWLEAKNKWERRLERINWNNLFITFSDSNTVPPDYELQLLKEFDSLDFPRKVCFTACKYLHLDSTIFIPDFAEDGQEIFLLSKKQLDIEAWIKPKKGKELKNYLKN